MTHGASGSKFDKPLSVFLILTFGFSWVLWVPMALPGEKISLPILAVGALSPSIFGILMTYRSADKASRADFWRRLFDVHRIGLVWYAVIGLLYPAIMAIAFLIEYLLGGELPSLVGAWETLTQPLALVSFILTMLVGGPLAEELGWRGFALDRLQSRWTALQASLLLGIIHAAWHLPLFFAVGTSQESMGFATIFFWLWIIQVIADSMFYTWIYNHNRRSTLSAILFHFMRNATFTIIAQIGGKLPLRIELVRTILVVLLVAVVVIVWGSKTMTKFSESGHGK
jgi:membrane protease YdiL (CAAX protease family)